jgi:hypothetical protein
MFLSRDTCQYLVTPWSTVLHDKLTGSQLVKKFPPFYGTRIFNTKFTIVPILSQLDPVHAHTSHLRSHLRLRFHSGLVTSGFPNKTLYTPLPSPICATCPAHFVLLYLITLTLVGEQYRSLSSCGFLHSPVTSSRRPKHDINHTLPNYVPLTDVSKF